MSPVEQTRGELDRLVAWARDHGARIRSNRLIRRLKGSGPRVRLAVTAALFALIVAAGASHLPQVMTGMALLSAEEDPVRLTELRLPAVATRDRLAEEIDEALRQGDPDLADSFTALADVQGVPVDPTRRQRVTAALVAAPGAGRDFATGFASGASDTWVGTAGALVADVVGFGDMRDLWQEGNKLYRGEPYDDLVLGLSAAGVALTGATVAGSAAVVSAAPLAAAKLSIARGLNFLKSARRAGLLSRDLAARLVRMTTETVNAAALRDAVAAARVLNLSAARRAAQQAMRPEALRTLTRLGEDTLALEARLGQRGAAQALNVAQNAREVGRIRRLAEAVGKPTRSALKLLGPAAFLLGNVLAWLTQALWLALTWSFAAALLARRIGLTLGRLFWGPARPRARLGRGAA